MNDQELFVKANDALARVIAQIPGEAHDRIVPDHMSYRPGMSLRRYMNMFAYENACVPDCLDGQPKQPSNDEFQGDLLGDDPQGNYARYHLAANEAAAALTDPDREVHISYGDFPASSYLRDITINRGLGAYDTAEFLGIDTTLPDDLVAGLTRIIEPVADDLRQFGVFGPAIEPGSGASPQDRLIALTGRQP